MNPDTIQQAYAAKRQSEADKVERSKKEDDYKKSLRSSDLIQRAIIKSAQLSIEHRDGHEPKVEVKNFPKVATQKDIKVLKETVDELGISEYLNHTDAVAEITDAIYELIAHLDHLPNKIKVPGLKSSPYELVDKRFEMLAKKLDSLPVAPDTVSVKNLSEIKSYFDALQKSIKEINVQPVVNVPKADKIDLSPILEALNRLDKKEPEEQPEEIEIEDFMVQNQKTEGNLQYFGFIHPKGYWMIMESDQEDGNYGYAFGTGDYSGSWNKRSNLAYGSVAGLNALYR